MHIYVYSYETDKMRAHVTNSWRGYVNVKVWECGDYSIVAMHEKIYVFLTD